MKLFYNLPLLLLSICLFAHNSAAYKEKVPFTSADFLEFDFKSLFASESPTLSPTGSPSASLAPSDSPSEVPTTVPSSAPSAVPTKSPAPSPSPSAAPTNSPSDSPSDLPTNFPTISSMPSAVPSSSPSSSPSALPSAVPTPAPSVSLAPSRSPSASPTLFPSDVPSEVPTAMPTHSQQPSFSPTLLPTDKPSDMPSTVPSTSPSDLPSEIPSSTPTLGPSAAPSVSQQPTTRAPTMEPSMSPTDVGFKSKTAISNVLLLDVQGEMTNEALAAFETITLKFIKDTLTATPGYDLEIMAVTVLSQEMFYNNGTMTPQEMQMEQETPATTTTTTMDDGQNDDEEGHDRLRQLILDDTNVLFVTFRTVAMVAEGIAPRDMDLASITEDGFDRYYGEYWYRLARANDFFEPLLAHVDSTTMMNYDNVSDSDGNDNNNNKEKKNKGQFIAAMLVAAFALILAVTATVYAVRKHLKNNEEKTLRLQYPGNGLRTATESEDKDSQDEDIDTTPTDGTIANTLQVKVQNDRIEMEDIGLTPVSERSYDSSDYDDHKEENEEDEEDDDDDDNDDNYQQEKVMEEPPSPNTMENGKKRSSYGRSFAADAGRNIKKWLTPRRTDFQNELDINDPPESEIGFEMDSRPPRHSMEPDAKKASTRNAAGVLSDEVTLQEEKQASKPVSNTEYSKPVHRNSNNFTGNTPLGIPISFFGQSADNRSDASSGHIESIAGSTASSFYSKMGRKSSVFTGRKSGVPSEAGMSAVTENSQGFKFGPTKKQKQVEEESNDFELNEHNLALLQASSKDNVETSVAGSNFDEIRSRFETGRSNAASSYSKPTSYVSQKRTEEIQPDSPARDDEEIELQFERESVYSEQSELDLNELGMEATLGARLPLRRDTASQGAHSFPGPEVFNRFKTLQAPSSVVGSRSHVSYAANSNHGSTAYSAPPQMNYSRDTRSMAVQEERRRSMLNSAIENGETYDVFAPAGPIGIVVDTSELGPAVHSLKSTSPMLGLINPGDLIIALDDEDTRNVTAAALTRLMAKKSRQKERKITLLAPYGL